MRGEAGGGRGGLAREALLTAIGDVAVALLPALLIALPATGRVVRASAMASWAALGRDQGIFQYVAWAVQNGDTAYRDVRDVNGPVVALVHHVFLMLGGADEHRFRQLDLFVTFATFALAGACLADLGGSTASLRPRRGFERVERAAWAVSALVVLAAQYLAYGFWDTAQRESFFDWFVLVALGLALTAQRRMREGRAFGLVLALAGAASFVPWLGKPTYVLFTIPHLVALAIDDVAVPRRDRLVPFLLGGAAGLAVPLAFLLARGDASAYLRITFVDVPLLYRFIFPRSAAEILLLPGYDRTAVLAVLTCAALLVLIVMGRLPRRALPLASLPLVGLASVIAQGKGFPYHFHPVSLGVSLALLVLAHAAWTAARVRGGVALALSACVCLGLGVRAAFTVADPPYPPPPEDPSSEALDARLVAFERFDFYPRGLRRAAELLAERTSPGDRVQMYGMDPYVLFLAKRKSATPYIYAYDLNADAALGQGPWGWGPPRGDEDVARILAIRDAHEADLFARLQRAPPAAFVFVDRSPLMSHTDALADFAACCAAVARWVTDRYEETAAFEGVRVFLPRPAP
jgi:hypothetical protein